MQTRETYKSAQQAAQEISFTILINNCFRELQNASFYIGAPKYDEELAAFIRKSGKELHLQMRFSSVNIDVFIPVLYRSACNLQHVYDFPVFERNNSSSKIISIDIFRFMEIVVSECNVKYPDSDKKNILRRLRNSISNMTTFLNFFSEEKIQVNKTFQTFIESEQNLVTGHSFHPLTKSREGFSDGDLLKYSPETSERFQVHYFLAHPSIVLERSTAAHLFSKLLREDLMTYIPQDHKTFKVITKNSDWKPVPVHPWEAGYLNTLSEVREMQELGLLIDIGLWGPLYTATSSVRTVYNENTPWMLKFSLHVKITSAERVNHLSEMHRGYDFSRLMQEAFGKGLQEQHPDIEFLYDPGFISVNYNGHNIAGFNTSFRNNPFIGNRANTNIGLLASLCQDEVLGQAARIASIIEKAAEVMKSSVPFAAKTWFDKYLDMILPATVTMFETYGFICELHQQNILIEMGNDYLPQKLYLRDNQSYLFRKTKKDYLCSIIPELRNNEDNFQNEISLLDLLSHFLITSNIAALIQAFGKNELVPESELIEIFYQKTYQMHLDNPGKITDYLLTRKQWCIKGNLLTAIRNIDAGTATASVVYLKTPNILHYRYISTDLLFPDPKKEVFSKYFPEEDINVSLRPVDPDHDIEMLHEWFHREHTLKIWRMNWSLNKLEQYYRKNHAGNHMYSYIGMINGEPTFNIEVYRAVADLVGDYYEVLPDDYGTHFMIATTDKSKKHPVLCMRAILDWLFNDSKVGRLVGEGSVESMAALINKAQVGFRLQKVIEMPHKKAHLNICYREWYREKFPDSVFNSDKQLLTSKLSILS
ncbi:IucA/IucC family protein [Sporocytophaga myxococcoides]|uniref:IucA/IucC family protein n=1 Tax=Sporocytophaga myxococcoides TaxID=153721 RepID=A0A098LFI6_9BACT|nr:GNAT family N-acetyltransferase [Sporocytophaga myxococcoides]GAL84858.1 IucA/IucC family protein [Sporocytophaga myxococcoides]